MKRHRLQSYGSQEGQGELFPVKVEDYMTTITLIDLGVDIFAWTAGDFCNGPRCVDCGSAMCHHHYPDWWKGECHGEL